jgi:hypothetical protein
MQVFENDEHIVGFLTDNGSLILNDLEESQNTRKEIHNQCVLTPKYYVTTDDQTNILDPKKELFVRKFQETQNINIDTSNFPNYINLGTSFTVEEIGQYTQLLKEFQDIFSWSYDDLKEYYKSIFHHVIPLKEGSKPFKKKLRMINLKIKSLVKIELEKF